MINQRDVVIGELFISEEICAADGGILSTRLSSSNLTLASSAQVMINNQTAFKTRQSYRVYFSFVRVSNDKNWAEIWSFYGSSVS